MIQSKSDYLKYLEADRIVLGKPIYTVSAIITECISGQLIWKYQRLLRKSEYYKNVEIKKSFFKKISYIFIK